MTITNYMFNVLGPCSSEDPNDTDDRAGYRENFHQGLFNLVVPVLRRRCKGLRKIMFGQQYQPFGEIGASWDVIMEQGSALVNPDISNSGIDTGYIDHVKYLYYPLHANPPTENTWAPDPPSSGYTVRSSFDLEAFSSSVLSPALTERWITALRDGPIFASIYGGINLTVLSCSLDLLERVYERQASAGHDGCLTTIKLGNVSPYDIHEFHRFSTVASHSLFLLSLTSDASGFDEAAEPRISFSDLPTLIDTIRTRLPSLRHLTLAFSGIETAEKICKGMLSANSLDDGGSLQSLTIHVQPSSTPLFNIIRCLAPLLRNYGTIQLDGLDSLVWPAICQAGYHKYLRSQIPERKKHLATCDFTSLDITSPREVLELTYRLDHTPVRRMVYKSYTWLAQAARGGKAFTEDQLPKLLGAIFESGNLSNHLQEISATASHAELLVETEKVLEAAVRAEEALLAIRTGLGVGRSVDLQRAVESLRELVALSAEEEQE